MKKITTGKSDITIMALLAIWSISAITSLPGLAISPIMGKLETIFPHATDLEIQMLTSLPSLMVIPFLFLSGKLSSGKNKTEILSLGLIIFLLSGISYFFINSMSGLIIASCILGIGAGIVIPLSTGLVAEYFAGRYRTQQLGISSAINNLSLVVATYLTGWLADINWHVPFAVYLLPIVSIILCRFLPKASSYTGNEDKSTTGTPANTNGITSKLAGLMVLYFFVTYSVLAIPLNLPFVMEQYKMDSNSSGAVIAIFFLAITLPGFFINKLLDKMGRAVNWINLLLIAIGLIAIYVSHHVVLFIIGSVLIGFGYGIIQPLIYDKTSLISTSGNVVMSLALVMSMNYLAVLISPFIIKFFGSIFATTSPDLIFIVNGMMVIVSAAIAMAKRKGFVLGK